MLKPGESQRENGSYDYRYTDAKGNRRCIYAPNLDELRRKEDRIQRDAFDGIDGAAGEITVSALVERYMSLRRNLKHNSMRAYQTGINRINADPFGERRINTIRISDAKAFLISLHDQGLKQNSIGIVHNILRPAFELAVEDDAIRKNPFKFKLCDVIANDAQVRNALTKDQQEKYLAVAREWDACHAVDYADDIEILLHTGLRVSELYGLTIRDVDLDARRIHVNKQLCRTGQRPYFVTSPKTASGIRYIPLTEQACLAIRRILQKRRGVKVEMMVDGYTGFLLLDKDSRPKTAMHLQSHMRRLQNEVNRRYGESFPRVTPHILRHTFCTNAQQAGMDIKALQAVMGHSNAGITLDVYTHVDYDAVERAFMNVEAAL